MRFVFNITAMICWPIALLLILTVYPIYFGDSEVYAERNRELIADFQTKVNIVEQYLSTNGRLPSFNELNGCSESDTDCSGAYSVVRYRPSDPDFDFPPWPTGKSFYVIDYWRGEWSEYYDSASRSFSMESADMASDWTKMGWEVIAMAVFLCAMPWLTSISYFLLMAWLQSLMR